MLLKDLPSTRKEVVLFKIQVQDLFCWKELPKAYSTLPEAMANVPEKQRGQVEERENVLILDRLRTEGGL
jgi:hypothetical protein